MGKALADIQLRDLIPSSIRGDATIAAIAAAVEPELQAVNQAIPSVLLWSRINELPEEIIDLLGWQFHCDFWRPDLDLDAKRRLVLSSYRWHKKKGTPWAVRTVLADMGYSDVELIEEFTVRNAWHAAGGHQLDGTWTLDGSVYLVPLTDVTDLPFMPHWAYFALRINLAGASRANFMDEIKAAVTMAKREVCWPIYLYFLALEYDAGPAYTAGGSLVLDTQLRPHFDELLLDGTWSIGVDAHVVRLDNTLVVDGTWLLGEMVPAVVHEYLYDRRLSSSAGVVMRSVIPAAVTVED